MEWAEYVALVDRLWALVDRDPERMRAIGDQIIRVPSYEFTRRFADNVVSLEAVYRMSARWLSPAFFPHLPISIAMESRGRIVIDGSIPEPFAPSLPFVFVCEGCIRSIPRLFGLPPARVVSTNHTPRRLHVVLDLPPSRSVTARVRRSVRSLLRTKEMIALLEEQRKELADGVEQMRRASDEFRNVLEGLPDPVAIHRDGAFLWVNPAFVKTLGYDGASELVGMPISTIIHESSLAHAMDHIRIPIGAQPERAEMRLRRRDGEMLIAEISPAQRTVFGGAEARLVVGRNVTERVRMQERLVTADRLSSLGLLAAGVAHEINNPLAYVLGSIENARRNLLAAKPDVSQTLEALATALEGVDRVRVIVRDLGVLSRSDDRAVEGVVVHTVLESTLTLAGREIEGRAKLIRDYQPVPDASINAARLGQVVLNLIVNALESMRDRDADERELRVHTSTDPSGRAIVEVSDTGRGIPPELVSRIFDPFFTTKAEGRGPGLGLAICHRLIAEAGGDISVDSTPGRGSTFRLTLVPTSSERRRYAPGGELRSKP
jgi:PAS domain S-box-containing protein